MHARRQDHTDGLPGWAQDWCVVSLGLAAGTAAAYRPAAPASGASHFLDCRANQLPVLDATEGCITGDMRLNGFPLDGKAFARAMGYVEQTDGVALMLPSLCFLLSC